MNDHNDIARITRAKHLAVLTRQSVNYYSEYDDRFIGVVQTWGNDVYIDTFPNGWTTRVLLAEWVQRTARALPSAGAYDRSTFPFLSRDPM